MLVVAAYIVEHTLAGLYIVQFAACHLLRIVCVVCVLFIQVIAQLVIDDLLFEICCPTSIVTMKHAKQNTATFKRRLPL